MTPWQAYNDKFNRLTGREQGLILLAGLFVIIMLTFTLSIESNLNKIKVHKQSITELENSNAVDAQSIAIMEQGLQTDPNEALNKEIAQIQEKLAQVDQALLTLTSELINPVEMRLALVDLLTLHKGVSLVSLDVVPAQAMFSNVNSPASEQAANEEPIEAEHIGLYRHGLKIRLKGKFAHIQQYLAQAEQLKWKFFWQQFDLQVTEYPTNELEITLYSLSTNREFIGV